MALETIKEIKNQALSNITDLLTTMEQLQEFYGIEKMKVVIQDIKEIRIDLLCEICEPQD